MVTAEPVVAALWGDAVVGLDPATGDELWSVPLPQREVRLVGGDAVWVLGGAADGSTLLTLDPTTGSTDEVADAPHTDPRTFDNIVPSVLGLRLVTETDRGSGTQQIVVAVSDHTGELWRSTLPGFVAHLISVGDQASVVVIDQTGGTGERTARAGSTVITVYDGATGDPQWQRPLPGTPHLAASLSDELLGVAVGTEIHALDATTGEARWVNTTTSPGRGNGFDLSGRILYIAEAGDDTGVGVALVLAEAPYRD